MENEEVPRGYNEIFQRIAEKEQRIIYLRTIGLALIPPGFIGTAGLIGKLVSSQIENPYLSGIAPVFTGALTASILILSGAITNYRETFRNLRQEARKNKSKIEYYRREAIIDRIPPRKNSDREGDLF